MFIYLAEEEDTGMGPSFDKVMCSECGALCSSFKYYKEIRHNEFSYKVLMDQLHCPKCGHTDYIVANNKGSYIEMELFPRKYNLNEERKEAKNKEQKRVQEANEIRAKSKKRNTVWKRIIRWKPITFNPNISIIQQLKDYLSELIRLGEISLLIVVLVGLLIGAIIAIAILSVTFILLFLSFFYLGGFFTKSMSLRMYVAATVVFSLFEIISPLVKGKKGMFYMIFAWPIIIYNRTEFPYLFQFIVLFFVTVINLGDFQLMKNNIFWDTISDALYPAVVTSILIREITDRHQYKPNLISEKKKSSRKLIEERKKRREEQKAESSRVVDDLYIRILRDYFGLITVEELEVYYPNIYRMVKNDFSPIIDNLTISERRVITIPKIIDLYYMRQTVLGMNTS